MHASFRLRLVLILSLVVTSSSTSPAGNVFEALGSVCLGAFEGSLCPYAVAYDIALQLASNWSQADGSMGLWSNGSSAIWWPSGVGLWSLAEFFHTMGGRGTCSEERTSLLCSCSATDKLYLSTRWAAIETARNENNYVLTKFTDDQAWWANGALRLEQYIRSTGDATQELPAAAQAVITDNTAHETLDCGGG